MYVIDLLIYQFNNFEPQQLHSRYIYHRLYQFLFLEHKRDALILPTTVLCDIDGFFGLSYVGRDFRSYPDRLL